MIGTVGDRIISNCPTVPILLLRKIMRDCNYCIFQRMKKEAIKNKQIIEIRNGNVYIRNKDEQLDTRSPDDGNIQWKCWFMELPDSCKC